MREDGDKTGIDRELVDLAPDMRWREWMRRVEAVLFATASPVSREVLARIVGQGASIDLLIDDLAANLADRSFDVTPVGAGWMLRTRPAYASVIHAAADIKDQFFALDEFDIAVLAAIAYNQPLSRQGLKDIFGKEIGRDLIGRLVEQGLIAKGPREPRRGAPYTFVTTDQFLATFDLETLEDLPDPEQMQDAGLSFEGCAQVSRETHGE
jgi:segregation and condensation protein B